MALTATYDAVLSRIRLQGTFLSPGVYAVFDRTVDGVRYTTVRGGSHVAIDAPSQTAGVDDYEFPPGVATTYRIRVYSALDALILTDTTVITQDLDGVWLKVPAAPFLNQPVVVADRSGVTRRSRAGLFDVVGRTDPVAVGDIASSQAFTLELITETPATERNLDYLFASGEVVFLQLPSTVEHFPGGYFSVGDVFRETTLRRSPRRAWTVPLTEVAAPGPAVVGSAYTWTSVLSDYLTWTTLIADNLTWADLLARTGTPSDVIVP